jgi:hypothetical protein
MGFIDEHVQPAILVKTASVHAPATEQEEVEHRPDLVAEGFGLLSC